MRAGAVIAVSLVMLASLVPSASAEIVPGRGSSFPGLLTEFGGELFFFASGVDGAVGLWKTDGDPGGATLVKELEPDTVFIDELTAVGTTLFFVLQTDTEAALWKSDGTGPGTIEVETFPFTDSFAPPLFGLTDLAGTLVFVATDAAGGSELWTSDGSAGGTEPVKDIFPGPESSIQEGGGFFGFSPLLTVFGTEVFFAADDGVNGVELWKSDGTDLGTELVKNIRTLGADSSPESITDVNGTLFFTATDTANGLGLWKSDGSDLGTVLIEALDSGDFFGGSGTNALAIGSTFYFVQGFGQLWKSDGSALGTVVIDDFDELYDLTDVNGTLYFIGGDPGLGYEVFKESGGQTQIVRDIRRGRNSSDPRSLTEFNGELFFAASDGKRGSELWRSDGTAAGTKIVKDINRRKKKGSFPYGLTVFNGKLYFSADDGRHGDELWRSGGTSVLTELL
jgi:ELWxxDGT repeat protein